MRERISFTWAENSNWGEKMVAAQNNIFICALCLYVWEASLIVGDSDCAAQDGRIEGTTS